jgi:hypothetical protein
MTFTLISPSTENKKLGKGVATSYRPVGDASQGLGTCPATCPHLPANGGKCYTRKYHVNLQQLRSNGRNDDIAKLQIKGAKLARLHTSGDLFKADSNSPDGYELDFEYINEVIRYCNENPDLTIWTYTHDVAKLIRHGYTYVDEKRLPKNLHIVASVETPVQQHIAKEYGFRTARVIDTKEECEVTRTLCPYDLALANGVKPKTTCAECKLCFNPIHKKDIAFIKH